MKTIIDLGEGSLEIDGCLVKMTSPITRTTTLMSGDNMTINARLSQRAVNHLISHLTQGTSGLVVPEPARTAKEALIDLYHAIKRSIKPMRIYFGPEE